MTTRRVRARALEQTGTEYRVVWRRAGWSSSTATKSRVLATRGAAERFAARLRRAEDRPPLTVLRIQHRPVGAWSDVPGWGSE